MASSSSAVRRPSSNNIVALALASVAALLLLCSYVRVVEAADGDDVLNYGVPAVYVAKINPVSTDDEVSGTAVVFYPNFDSLQGNTGQVGYTGTVTGVESDLTSPSENCTVKNACGSHIHNGTGCETSELQVRSRDNITMFRR